MLAHIKGIVDRIAFDNVIIDVNGIGYRVYTSTSTIANASVGEVVKLYTYTNLREDSISLFGFFTESELRQFEQLLSVTGVGPKAALAVLSSVPPAIFGLAVLNEDADTLAKAQGVGKKTAQRIILELKDKIRKEQGSMLRNQGISLPLTDAVPEQGVKSEAIAAMGMLGYNFTEAQRAVAEAYQEGKSLEDVLRDALRSKWRI